MISQKYQKNILAVSVILAQLLVVLILLLDEGANRLTDYFFLSLTVLSVLQLLVLMTYEQFIVFYNKKKAVNRVQAELFYVQVIVVSVLTAFLVISLILFLVFIVKSYFLSQDSLFREYLDLNLLYGFLYSLPAYAVISLNDRYYNAKGKINKSYVFVLAPNLSLLIATFLWSFFLKGSIEIVGFLYSGILWLFAVPTAFSLIKTRMKRVDCFFCGLRPFVLNSMSTRLGHNIYAISFQTIVNFILLGMQEGAVTLFNYAYRFVLAIFSVTVSPLNKVLMFDLSVLGAKNKLQNYNSISNKYIKHALFQFCFLSVLGLISLLIIKQLHQISSLNIDLGLLVIMFGIVVVWQLVVIIESVYVGIIITSLQSVYFVIVNSLFVLTFFFSSLVAASYSSVLFLGVAGFLSQLLSLYLYRLLAMRILRSI